LLAPLTLRRWPVPGREVKARRRPPVVPVATGRQPRIPADQSYARSRRPLAALAADGEIVTGGLAQRISDRAVPSSTGSVQLGAFRGSTPLLRAVQRHKPDLMNLS